MELTSPNRSFPRGRSNLWDSWGESSSDHFPSSPSKRLPVVPCSPLKEGITKLVQAIKSHDEEAVANALCLYRGEVDPNKFISQESMSLLHLSVGLSDNCTSIIEKLLREGGNPNNTSVEDHLSPLHLSVIFDHDKVLQLLMRHGGDPMVLTGEGKSCYDIAKENLEDEMKEKCFTFFYRRSISFRKSIKPTDSVAMVWKEKNSNSLTSLSDVAFFSCDSEAQSGSEALLNAEINQVASNQLIFDNCKYSYLMTEDESSDDGRLSTIQEESNTNLSTPRHVQRYHCQSTEDVSLSAVSDSDPSCANSTPPLQAAPSPDQLNRLQDAMKNLRIPVTPSTYGVLTKYTGRESVLAQVLSPKPGTQNFSSELKMSIERLNLIVEWGNLKVDLLQNLTPTAKMSKSFYNYLLLDPKILKKANFSGNHLKSGVINSSDKFETFLRSVFYIGKGCGRRPIQHLVDAKKLLVATNRKSQSSSAGEKIEKVLEIWKSGLGVVIVSLFHHSSEREANVNEACMIDAIGLVELSNLKKGSYGGTIATKWSQKTKNQFGSFLLHKCFCAFAVGDHKPFHPRDV